MSNLKVSTNQGVTCAMATVKLFGNRLNVYVYEMDGLLVDTGPSRYAREFTAFFQKYSIKLAALTHYHEDHSGNAPWLEQRGVPVYVHSSSAAVCREKAGLPIYRRYFWGGRDKFKPLPLPPVLETKTGFCHVIETPGHSYDHVVFYNPASGSVFTGDLFVTPKTRLVLRSENVPQIINSLRNLLTFDFRTVYCGHAGVVESGRELIQSKLDYLENLQGEVLKLHQKGWSIRAITKKIFPRTAPLYLISGGEWAAGHIVRSIVEDNNMT